MIHLLALLVLIPVLSRIALAISHRSQRLAAQRTLDDTLKARCATCRGVGSVYVSGSANSPTWMLCPECKGMSLFAPVE